MKIILCIDDKNGMMFNKRRQSQDRLLREQMLQITSPASLWMSEYSAKQFSDILGDEPRIQVSNDFLSMIPAEAYCFIEDAALPAPETVDTLILYRWNRHYPSDRKFDWDLAALGFTLQGTSDFPGSSHEVITEEIYIR